jgi:hypothetical protein
LIGYYVSIDASNTARIDAEWGGQEFNGDRVDIELKTLYQFVSVYHYKEVA